MLLMLCPAKNFQNLELISSYYIGSDFSSLIIIEEKHWSYASASKDYDSVF